MGPRIANVRPCFAPDSAGMIMISHSLSSFDAELDLWHRMAEYLKQNGWRVDLKGRFL
jgi:hypothetical protein